MFEITKEQISQLNDTDLRLLVGKLCEQTILKNGLSTVGVTYGGNQDSPDGGIDVRVSINGSIVGDYIPRSDTAFQVKKHNIPPAKLRGEICPDGNLRDCIAELIIKKGAYVVVSGGEVTDIGLKNRKKAIAECVSHADHNSDLFVDFYDAQRIASWANMYPAILVWINNRIGAVNYNGWQPYGPWSNPAAQTSDDYILDTEIRIRDLYSNNEGISIMDAINQIRTKLTKPNAIARITGLSGVGKTRFVESLFDKRLGSNFISPNICIYGDIAAELSPSPVSVARELVISQKDTVLIIDNCSPETHGVLAKICSVPKGRVRLITVEYDVKDDMPEESTDVYTMESASNSVIEHLLERRYPNIDKADVETITEFSGGNARVALALANTLERGQSLAGLRSQELFERLFYQRNSHDTRLLKAARILALVYSFNGDYGNKNCELDVIAELIGISDLQIYEYVQELEERKLVQTRRPWKAVLPHAIANRLAKEAFQKIPWQQIETQFCRQGNERLLKSLSHRMSYLHDCEEAILLARSWITGAILGDFSCYESHQHFMLQYLAPIVPAEVLDMLLKVSQNDEGLRLLLYPRHSTDYAILIGQIGYESCYFDKAARILIPMALQETRPANTAMHVLEAYSQLYLSGTHATLVQRLSLIKELIENSDSECQELGFKLLNKALGTDHFIGYIASYHFGALSRNDGYRPESTEDYCGWYRCFIQYIVDCIIRNQPLSAKMKIILANHARPLCSSGMLVDIEEAAKLILIQPQSNWIEGWHATIEMLLYDSKRMSSGFKIRVEKLRDTLAPQTLKDKVRAFVLVSHHFELVLPYAIDNSQTIDTLNDGILNKYIYQLGKELGKDVKTLNAILPLIFSEETSYRVLHLGAGIASETNDIIGTWQMIMVELKNNVSVLNRTNFASGYINSICESFLNAGNDMLDQLLNDTDTIALFPAIQICCKKSSSMHKRLLRAAEKPETNAACFFRFWTIDEYSNENNCLELLTLLMQKDNSQYEIIELLSFLLDDFSKKEIVAPRIKQLGLFAIASYDYQYQGKKHSNSDMADLYLSKVLEHCFNANQTSILRTICISLMSGLRKETMRTVHYQELLKKAASLMPCLLLDAALPDGREPDINTGHILSGGYSDENILDQMDHEMVLLWGNVNKPERYPKLARISNLMMVSQNICSLLPLAKSLINEADNPVVILEQLNKMIELPSWDGTWADMLRAKLPVLEVLKQHLRKEVASWASEMIIEYNKRIAKILEEDTLQELQREMSFEP